MELTGEEWRTTARTVAFGAGIGLTSGNYYDMKTALDWLLDKLDLVYVAMLDTKRNAVLTKNPANRSLFVPDAGRTTRRETRGPGPAAGLLHAWLLDRFPGAELAVGEGRAWVLGAGAFAVGLGLAWGLGTVLDRQNAALAAAPRGLRRRAPAPSFSLAQRAGRRGPVHQTLSGAYSTLWARKGS